VTSNARAFPPEEDEAVLSPEGEALLSSEGEPAADGATTADEPATPSRRRRRRAARGSGDDEPPGTRARLSLPLVPVLATLLVLLLAAVGYLWLTRPEPSAIRTGDYVQALQAARSGVVDLTSFDHLTLDDDIEQIRRVATGDLREESVTQLDDRRQEITEAQAVVNTEVVGAGVTRADDSDATVLLVIQSTQKSTASPQAQVVRYRIQVELQKKDGRWLLSGISGR
jgi:Mce-associated membrane protein